MLLDSHVLLWLLYEPQKIGPLCIKKLSDAAPRLVSVASLWELAIKHKNGKLPYEIEDILQNYLKAGLTLLPIDHSHIELYQHISLLHLDPFDHMLIAQATHEDCVLVTADKTLLDSTYKTIDAKS